MIDIKTYAKDMTPIKLMQMLINLFAESEMTHDVISRKMHMLGFQGAKRYNRCKSTEYRCSRIEAQHFVIDIYGMDLEPSWERKDIDFNDYKSYLEYLLDDTIARYSLLNKIHNELISNGYNTEAEIAKDFFPIITKEIEKVRRWILEGENCNWDYALLRIFDDKLHDKMKQKEEK